MFFLVLSRPQPNLNTKVTMLGFDQPLHWTLKYDSNEQSNLVGYMSIDLPPMSKMQHVQWAWTLKFTNCQ